MNEQEEKYDFSIKLTEKKIEKEENRYLNFNQKINFYFIFLALTVSMITVICKFLLENIVVDISKIEFKQVILMLKLFSLIFLIILVMLLFYFLFKLLKKMLDSLIPINLTYPNNESIEKSVSEGTLKAKKIYLTDLKNSLLKNREAINSKYNILYSINDDLKMFIYIFFIILAFMIITIAFKKFV